MKGKNSNHGLLIAISGTLVALVFYTIIDQMNFAHLTRLNDSQFLAAVSSTATKTIQAVDLRIKQHSFNVFSLTPQPVFNLTAPSFSHLPLTKNPYITTIPPKKPVDIPSIFNNLVSNSKQSPSTGPSTQPAAQTIVPTKVSVEPVLPKTQTPTVTAPANIQSVINILCIQKMGTQRKTVTGTGILIHSDGTILTNAHVAQYPLASEKVGTVTCSGRIGKVANTTFPLRTVFISPTWTEQNAQYINTGGTLQTGALDYALLKIEARNLSQLGLKPIDLSFDSPQTGSSILAIAYPADILASNPGAVLNLETEALTITKTDSLGYSDSKIHIIETSPSRLAQRGSSGGLISSLGNQMLAMITIVLESRGAGQNRTIRAITPHHINADLSQYVSGGLDGISRTGSQVIETKFNQTQKPRLLDLFVQYLKN